MAGLGSLGQALGGGFGEKRTSAVLSEIDDLGNIILGDELEGSSIGPQPFQYFPETLTDTKAVNYQRQNIPGSSLPLYQWISSGERVLSFQAVFTSDTDITSGSGQLNRTLALRQEDQGVGDRNIDIRSTMAWLRRFTLPEYIRNGSEVGTPLTKAPPRCLLTLAGSGIGLAGGALGAVQKFDGQDSILAYMSQCDIVHEVFWPSGVPRIVSVSLSFIEIAQLAGLVSFPSRTDFMTDVITGNNSRYLGYSLNIRESTGEGFDG